MKDEEKEKKMLRAYDITIKQSPPLQLIEEPGLAKRWQKARADEDEYFETMCGTILTAAILGVMDTSMGQKAAQRCMAQMKEMGLDKRSGLHLPTGLQVIDQLGLGDN